MYWTTSVATPIHSMLDRAHGRMVAPGLPIPLQKLVMLIYTSLVPPVDCSAGSSKALVVAYYYQLEPSKLVDLVPEVNRLTPV